MVKTAALILPTLLTLLTTACALPVADLSPQGSDKIPVECTDRVAAVYRHGPPPADAPIGAGWLQAVSLQGRTGDNLVETQSIRFYWKRGGVWQLRENLTFQDQPWSTWNGALYSRFPWFGTDAHEAMPQVTTQGSLILRPSLRPDRVWHWWNQDRTPLPPDVRGIRMAAMVRSTGAAVFQGGLDYRSTADGQSPYGVAVSDWYGAEDGWVTIDVAAE